VLSEEALGELFSVLRQLRAIVSTSFSAQLDDQLRQARVGSASEESVALAGSLFAQLVNLVFGLTSVESSVRSDDSGPEERDCNDVDPDVG
jgi:hypothetical protein